MAIAFVILLVMIFAIMFVIQMQTKHIFDIAGHVLRLHRTMDDRLMTMIQLLEQMNENLADQTAQLDTFEGWIPDEDFNESHEKGVRRRMERKEAEGEEEEVDDEEDELV